MKKLIIAFIYLSAHLSIRTFIYLLICISAYLHICIPKKVGTLLRSAFAFFLICIFAHLPIRTSANNLTLGSTITIVDGSNISFTIQWDNSWYTASPANWDAVWLFVKYKDCTTTNWLHAPLSTTLADHSVSGGGGLLIVELPVVNDGNGVFIRRAAAGSGNIASAETVTLKLGVATGSYNFKVFGIEMVYIPQGDFQIGDGAATGTFSSVTIDAAKQSSGFANTSAAIGGTGTTTNAMAATYPMGYNAMYCMKYETTQEQYVDFLNTLTYDQQISRTAVLPSVMATNWAMGSSGAVTGRNRNGIKVKTSGVPSTTPAEYACDLNGNGTEAGANYNEATDGQNIPCNFINWSDLGAYLDWACLRPFTDLEFEKICRGVGGRIAGEYVWGTTQITFAGTGDGAGVCSGCVRLTTNYGASTEICSNSGSGLVAYGFSGNCYTVAGCSWVATYQQPNSYTPPGPLRAGFAATASTTRIGSGATYFGVMEMGGNVYERIVAVNATGVLFQGTLGDGVLTTTAGYAGNATNTDWPGIDGTPARGITGATGCGLRGGDWYDAAVYLQTSDRQFATGGDWGRDARVGGRGVR